MSEDYGKHLMDVDNLLQKHSLLEADIHVLGERVKTVNLQAMKFVDGDFSEVGGNLTLSLTFATSHLLCYLLLYFLTDCCMQTAKPQISLGICTV